MEIIIDTDVVIAAERGDFDLEAWLMPLINDRFTIAAVTVAELWHGVERATVSHRRLRQEYLEEFIGSVAVLPYTEQTAYEHARIWAHLESTGQTIGLYDLIVAATAIERGSAVATFNKRHFSRISGLTVIEPAHSRR